MRGLHRNFNITKIMAKYYYGLVLLWPSNSTHCKKTWIRCGILCYLHGIVINWTPDVAAVKHRTEMEMISELQLVWTCEFVADWFRQSPYWRVVSILSPNYSRTCGCYSSKPFVKNKCSIIYSNHSAKGIVFANCFEEFRRPNEPTGFVPLCLEFPE